MNKKIKILSIIISILLVVGCSSKNSSIENDNHPEKYTLIYNDKEFELGTVFTREKYGKEIEYSEVPSCAFEGLDKTYKYAHYEITTYQENNNDIILSIYFLDTEIKTTEGISIGDSLNDVINKYGNNYVNNGIEYNYTLGHSSIIFLVENNIVTSIEYKYIQ